MAIEVTMPKLSDTMEEGKILKWTKQVGDPVAIGDVLAEVETDKANMELEAFDEGVLAEVRTAEGQSAPVGAVIAVLAAPGEEVKPAPRRGEPPKQAAKPADGSKPAPTPGGVPTEAEREVARPTLVRRAAPSEAPAPRAADPDRVKVSPFARKLAAEHQVDLSAVRGTGPGGRIVEADVRAAVARAEPAPAEEAPPPRKPSPRTGGAAAPAARRVELSRIRRTTAKRMGEAKREIPHFYASAEIAMDEAARMKDELSALGGEWAGLSFTHLVLKATGLALRRVPELNGSYDGDALVLHDAVNVGMATAVDDGLVVPVVRDCDTAPLATIVRQARELVERARAGKFATADLSGGTFTVSNLGMHPVLEFAAVINPPQAAILAVGTIREVPVVRDGALAPGRSMIVTLSCDHRVIDGVLAGRFLGELKRALESPLTLLVAGA